VRRQIRSSHPVERAGGRCGAEGMKPIWAIDNEDLSRRLIGDLPIETFNRDVREQRSVKFDATFDPPALHAVYDIGRLEAALANAAIPPLFIDIYCGGQLAKLTDVQNKSGKSNLAVLIEQVRRGATVRVRELQMFDARIADLVGAVQRLFAARSQINLYLTPPSTAGFPPHFDITDVFILQCAGAKQWTVFDQYADQQPLPLADTPWEPDRYTPRGAGETTVLKGGDVLYLPRGTMHAATCLSWQSMHLTISLSPLTVADVLAREVKRFAESDVTLRRRAVWSLSGDSAALTAEIKEHFRAIAESADAQTSVDAERRAIGGETNALPTTGMLMACLASLEAQSGA
jgi:hypothetical protein